MDADKLLSVLQATLQKTIVYRCDVCNANPR